LWWGNSRPRDWRPEDRFEVYFSYSPSDPFRCADSAPSAPGFTEAGPRGRRICLRLDLVRFPSTLTDLLHHEVMHAINRVEIIHDIPMWADEGIAMNSESRASRANFMRYLNPENRVPAAELMESWDYPAADRLTGFYGSSQELTDYFISRLGTRRDFLRFVAMLGKDRPVEGPLDEVYRVTPAEVERRLAALVAGLPTGWLHDDEPGVTVPPTPDADPYGVTRAVSVARASLRAGNYREAVEVLEKKLTYIDGNAAYLDLLKQAYQGYIAQLRAAGRDAEADRFQQRLDILDR
jgi:hypothetical protein